MKDEEENTTEIKENTQKTTAPVVAYTSRTELLPVTVDKMRLTTSIPLKER